MDTLNYIYQKYQIAEESRDKVRIEIPNTDRISLARLFGELKFKVGAEIGVERAIYSKSLLTRIPELKLYLVDPWKAYKGYREHVSQSKLDGFYNETVKRVANWPNTEIVRKYSIEAARTFPDKFFDFVYIDANHEFRHAVDDIAEWYPKVKVGGILAGHDYIKRNNPEYLMGVIPAINGYIEAYDLKPLFIFGRKEFVEGEKRDKPRSWMLIKEK